LIAVNLMCVGFRWNYSSWLWRCSPGDTAAKEEWCLLCYSGTVLLDLVASITIYA